MSSQYNQRIQHSCKIILYIELLRACLLYHAFESLVCWFKESLKGCADRSKQNRLSAARILPCRKSRHHGITELFCPRFIIDEIYFECIFPTMLELSAALPFHLDRLSSLLSPTSHPFIQNLLSSTVTRQLFISHIHL